MDLGPLRFRLCQTSNPVDCSCEPPFVAASDHGAVVAKMLNFIRSPTWITPEFSEGLAAQGRETVFTPEQIQRFKDDKQYFLQYRKQVQNFGSASYSLYYKDSDLQQKVFREYTEMMKQRLDGNEELINYIIPKFPVGCRRYVISAFVTGPH